MSDHARLTDDQVRRWVMASVSWTLSFGGPLLKVAKRIREELDDAVDGEEVQRRLEDPEQVPAPYRDVREGLGLGDDIDDADVEARAERLRGHFHSPHSEEDAWMRVARRSMQFEHEAVRAAVVKAVERAEKAEKERDDYKGQLAEANTKWFNYCNDSNKLLCDAGVYGGTIKERIVKLAKARDEIAEKAAKAMDQRNEAVERAEKDISDAKLQVKSLQWLSEGNTEQALKSMNERDAAIKRAEKAEAERDNLAENMKPLLEGAAMSNNQRDKAVVRAGIAEFDRDATVEKLNRYEKELEQTKEALNSTVKRANKAEDELEGVNKELRGCKMRLEMASGGREDEMVKLARAENQIKTLEREKDELSKQVTKACHERDQKEEKVQYLLYVTKQAKDLLAEAGMTCDSDYLLDHLKRFIADANEQSEKLERLESARDERETNIDSEYLKRLHEMLDDAGAGNGSLAQKIPNLIRGRDKAVKERDESIEKTKKAEKELEEATDTADWRGELVDESESLLRRAGVDGHSVVDQVRCIILRRDIAVERAERVEKELERMKAEPSLTNGQWVDVEIAARRTFNMDDTDYPGGRFMAIAKAVVAKAAEYGAFSAPKLQNIIADDVLGDIASAAKAAIPAMQKAVEVMDNMGSMRARSVVNNLTETAQGQTRSTSDE